MISARFLILALLATTGYTLSEKVPEDSTETIQRSSGRRRSLVKVGQADASPEDIVHSVGAVEAKLEDEPQRGSDEFGATHKVAFKSLSGAEELEDLLDEENQDFERLLGKYSDSYGKGKGGKKARGKGGKKSGKGGKGGKKSGKGGSKMGGKGGSKMSHMAYDDDYYHGDDSYGYAPSGKGKGGKKSGKGGKKSGKGGSKMGGKGGKGGYDRKLSGYRTL